MIEGVTLDVQQGVVLDEQVVPLAQVQRRRAEAGDVVVAQQDARHRHVEGVLLHAADAAGPHREKGTSRADGIAGDALDAVAHQFERVQVGHGAEGVGADVAQRRVLDQQVDDAQRRGGVGLPVARRDVDQCQPV